MKNSEDENIRDIQRATIQRPTRKVELNPGFHPSDVDVIE